MLLNVPLLGFSHWICMYHMHLLYTSVCEKRMHNSHCTMEARLSDFNVYVQVAHCFIGLSKDM